ncbi:hypothetical protein JST97_08665 [bacterium]|nr:hypothetical protein [bacterium]
MEIPSWAGKVATVAGLSNPITAPVVVGKWVADKAASALGPKTEAPAPVVTQPAPAAPPKPAVINEQPGEVKPKYNEDPAAQTNGAQKLVGGDGKWNGADILNSQTQLSKDDPSYKAEQQNRCGPSAVLASQVMKGPQATGDLVGKLAGKVADQEGKDELMAIQARIKEGQATHEDLSRVQHYMYKQYHEPGQKPGLTTSQLTQMETDLTGGINKETGLADFDGGKSFRTTAKDRSGVEESPDKMKARLENLKPGQSFVQFVDTDGDNKFNHYVLMGKDANGRSYSYDPMPKTNQPQVIYQDTRPQAYGAYADGSMGIQEADGSRGQAMAGGTLN